MEEIDTIYEFLQKIDKELDIGDRA